MGRSMSRRVDVEPAQAASAILHEEVESKAAVAKNDPDAWAEIDDLLRNSPPEVEDPYKRTMYTALQLAAKYGRVQIVSDLLMTEEFVNVIGLENPRGETALHLAAKGGHHEIVKQLSRYYSGPSSIESFVNHKSHYSKSQSGDEGSQKALLNDSKSRYIVYVRRLLSFQCKQRKAETNAHRTALHYASAGGHLETVKHLLSIPEVNAGLADYEENTALHLAISKYNNSCVDVVDILKELLAVPTVIVNHHGKLGDTPLHRAVREENIDAVELLCGQKRLIATKRNHHERTPLRLAWELQLKSSNQDTLEIVKNQLLERTDVRKDEAQFKSERENLYTAVNALLVGGTLLASVTFGGILEMPTLPPESHFGTPLSSPSSTTSAGGAPTPAQEVDFKDRQWLYIRVIDLFRGSNNMCFFLALITLILAIQVPISRRRTRVHVYVEEEVEHLRTRSVLVSFCLTLSTFCAGVAFVTGGLAKVPVSESGWSLVLSRWVRTEWKLVFESTMLTTNLSMGFVLFIILMYTVCMDYFYILRYQVSKRFSLPSLATFLFSVLLFCLVLVVVVLLIFGYGLFQHYYDLP